MRHDEQSVARPDQALDALEERVLGATIDQERDEHRNENPDATESAFDIDLDAEDQGTADAAAANPD